MSDKSFFLLGVFVFSLVILSVGICKPGSAVIHEPSELRWCCAKCG